MGLLDIDVEISNSKLVDFIFMKERPDDERWYRDYIEGNYVACWSFQKCVNITIEPHNNQPHVVELIPILELKYDLESKKFTISISPNLYENPELQFPIEYRNAYKEVKKELKILLKPFENIFVKTEYEFNLIMDALKTLFTNHGYKLRQF